ncbi:hypothetical protein M0R45_010495 [Rubus argutus]|uniref:Uncharacterized protein n=1 Tax=Rubus argutus TaxID=59490 RepID=A0AAW1YAA9_RUBAR
MSQVFEMETKEDAEGYDEGDSSPIQVFQQISEEAFRVAGEALNNLGNSSMPPLANGGIGGPKKRQWYQLHSKSKGHVNYKEPTSLFEHFIIAGLHPDTNLENAEATFIKRKRWETDMINSGITDLKLLQQKGPPIPNIRTSDTF